MMYCAKTKCISLFLAVLFTVGLFVPTSFALGEVYIKANFDDLTLVNDGTTAGTQSLPVQTGSFYFSWQPKQPISITNAPSPSSKLAGTTFSESDTDKAVMIDIQSGSTSNSYFSSTIDPTKVDLYNKGKVTLSFNVYVDSYAGSSHAIIQVYMKGTSTSIYNDLLSFRSSGYIQSAGVNLMQYTKKKWYNVRFDFDTKAKTYDLIIDGVPQQTGKALANTNVCFPGDPDTTKTILKETRFYVNNGQNSTGSRVYVDDVYYGEPFSDAVTSVTAEKLYFSSGSSELGAVEVNADKVYGKADIIYSNQVTDPNICLAGAYYDPDGKLERIWKKDISLTLPQTAGNNKTTVDMEIDLTGVNIEEGGKFKLFAFNALNGLTPLSDTIASASVFSSGEYVNPNPVIYLVSDSICMDYTSNNYPQQGYGNYLKYYFNDNVTVSNWAKGGRSTRSFIDEGRWDGNVKSGYIGETVTAGVLNYIKQGDYVFLAMGHNDKNMTADANGYVKGTTISEYKDYIRRYIDETRAANANIILVTSITEAGGDNLTAGSFKTNTLLERAQAMKEVAQEKNVILLDVNGVTFNEFTSLGYNETIDRYYMSANAINKLLTPEQIANHPNKNVKLYGQDLTHVTETGADYIAGKIAGLLSETSSPLKAFLKDFSSQDRTLDGRVSYNLYPDAKNKAVTFSFDDGKATDRQLVQLLNNNGLKGTFHIVPTWLDDANGTFIKGSEVSSLYAGHEVALHGNTHSRIESQTPDEYKADTLQSQAGLKALTGYKSFGYAYPFGGVTDTVTPPKTTLDQAIECLKQSNVVYGRTSKTVSSYELPSNFYQWNFQVRVGTGTQVTQDAFERVQTFLAQPTKNTMQILMVFGHGHEIADYTLSGKTDTGWTLFGQLCTALANNTDVWYASSIDIANYVNAVNNLRIDTQTKTIRNPSATSVWLTVDGIAKEIKPEQSITLQ